MRKNKLQFLIILSIAFYSCYGPKKVNSWVTKQDGPVIQTPPKIKDDYFSISSKLVTNDQQASTTVKQVKNVLPLLFYWRLHYINTVTLNPKIPVNNFITAFQTYARTKQLKEKLNGQKIELSIDQIPNVFAIDDKGQLIWVIYAFGWDIFSIVPQKTDMIVSYRILKENAEVKKGTITIPDQVKSLVNLRRVRNGTEDYLTQYDESIKLMTKKLVDKIIEEL